MKTFVTILTSENKEPKIFPKNAKLFGEGERCNYVGIVISGHLRIVSSSLEGKELIYKDLHENGIFGQNLLFSNDPFYRGDVISVDDSKVLLLNRDEFLSLMKNNADFLETYLWYQSEESKKLNQTIKTFSLQTAEEKLMYFIKLHHGEIKIKNVTELSKRLNITREATSRIIHKLIRNGTITISNNIIKSK